MKERVANPCIGYCRLNDQGICGGCGRTQDERTDWIFLTGKQQTEIVERAKVRLDKIKSEQKSNS